MKAARSPSPCSLATASAAQTAAAPERTIVHDPAALARLRRNSGITLQWISFEAPARGHVVVTERGGLVHLRGVAARAAAASSTLDGDVLSIDARSFTFRGEISIVGTPDLDPQLPARRHLRIPRHRPAPLLAAAADRGLRRPADYVDIYF